MLTSLTSPPAPLQVLCIPAFADNYLWLIHNGRHACAVDPGDAAPILAALDAHQLLLCAILITHHHLDHCGGVNDLIQHAEQQHAERQHAGQPPIPVYGPANETINGVTQRLDDGASVLLPELGLALEVLAVPGHTRGHIAYYAAQEQWLFCGDTLFAGGCGRLFEGSAQQMADSLARLAALPDRTLVYCAHEYTLSNLKFAHEVEPMNPALAARISDEQAKRAQGLPTVPSTIALERASNPFLRCGEAAIIALLEKNGRLNPGSDPVQVFAALRTWKNDYR
jgi:hydroxyacylglutathione hydrolase